MTISIGCIDCLRYGQTQRAVEETLKRLKVDCLYWLSDKPYPGQLDIPIHWHRIPGFLNGYVDDYNYYTLKLLPKVVETDHNLIIHWDGFAANAAGWTDEFLEYDYIGARWNDDPTSVGNGGFTLRSRKLYNALNDLNVGYRYIDFNPEQRDPPGITCQDARTGAPVIPEDNIICKVLRTRLEKEYGIRFASGHLADRFSIEPIIDSPWIGKSFGFHGMAGARHHGVTL